VPFLTHSAAAVADVGATPILFETLTLPHSVGILIRMSCAFLLGAAIAYRPWRRLPGSHAPRITPETAQAQTIIAVAGALMVVVIGDSLARAFGLVGLGTFIRFRSGIKDPRDVAIMFMMIGVGMACGLGLVPTAAVGTLFVGTVLALFDRFGRPHRVALRVAVATQTPEATITAMRAAFPETRVVETPREAAAGSKIIFEIAAREEDDAASIAEALRAAGASGIVNLRAERD
jgi:uncharacterized membrane protein YhiD involved in acid resistance